MIVFDYGHKGCINGKKYHELHDKQNRKESRQAKKTSIPPIFK